MKSIKTLLMLMCLLTVVISLSGCEEMKEMADPVITTPPQPTEPEDVSENTAQTEETTQVEDTPEDTTQAEETTQVEDTTQPTVEGPVIRIVPASVSSPAVGEPLVIEIDLAEAENVFGYEFILGFDASALRYVDSANGDYLPGAFLSATASAAGDEVSIVAGTGTASNAASGTLVSVTFEVVMEKASSLTLSDALLEHGGETSTPTVIGGEIVK